MIAHKNNVDPNIICTDNTYFTIYSVDLLYDDELKKIHKIRFGID